MYSITYDLLKEKDYAPLITRLQQLGAVKVEYSQWLLKTASNAAAIRDDLARYMDADDRLMVMGLTGEAAWRGKRLASDEVVQKVLAA